MKSATTTMNKSDSTSTESKSPSDLIDTRINELGDWRGVRRATLSDLVNAKSAISPEMALRIEKAFGVNMDTLLKLQAWHDTCAMRERAGKIKVRQYAPSLALRSS